MVGGFLGLSLGWGRHGWNGQNRATPALQLHPNSPPHTYAPTTPGYHASNHQGILGANIGCPSGGIERIDVRPEGYQAE